METVTSRPKTGARSLTGHRLGAWHQQAKYDDETVRAARILREEQNLTYAEIGNRLRVPWITVRDWVNYRTRISA